VEMLQVTMRKTAGERSFAFSLVFCMCLCRVYCWEFVLLTRIELSIMYPKLETKNERSR
jgi:hypothetical protein